jgi:hypothetical protein
MVAGDRIPQALGVLGRGSPARLGARKEKPKMATTTLSVPVFSLRRIETPYERQHGYKNYLAVVDARNLPDLNEWREINVRDAKVRGRVPSAIRESFTANKDQFLFMNRGLVVAAQKVEFREMGSRKVMDLIMKDPAIHGLLDGGHTYRVVTETVKNLGEDEDPRFVRVEVITGFGREEINEVVEGRNTSNQVKDESLANLNEAFDPIKDILKKEKYFDLIAWKEYEEQEDGKPKPIDIRDIISYLVAFDNSSFSSTTQPIIAYADKRACLRHFLRNAPHFERLYHLLPDILKVWDQIHSNWQDWYNEGREEEAGIRGRFGKLTAVTVDSDSKLYFAGGKANYRMPEAYKYPILGALRAAVSSSAKRNPATWRTNPFDLMKETGQQLTNIVGNSVRATNNPNKVGKDAGTWSSCYLVVESALRGTVARKAEKKIEELQAELAELRRAKQR